MAPIKEVDLGRPAFKADPYPLYARLRAEAPVCPLVLADGRSAWLVTRYDDVAAMLKDDRFVHDGAGVRTPEQEARQPWVPKAFKRLQRNLLSLDAPDHTRLRTVVQRPSRPGSSGTCRRASDRWPTNCSTPSPPGDEWT